MNSTGREAQEMEELMSDPRFQNLLGKAESHQWKFRPKESEHLDSTGELLPMLQRRTKECWEMLSLSRKSGMSLSEAQEVAYPKILVPSETN
jgi:hypothetical protein